MSSKKILFFSLTQKIHGHNNSTPGRNCKEVLEYIDGLTPLEKQFDLTDNKFCQLESISGGNTQRVLFKAANDNYRAPLLNRRTGQERDNPKTLTEGERIKTHMVIKYKRDDVIICIERGSGTLTIQQFVNYLNHKADIYHANNGTDRDYSFDFLIIVEDNFLQEIDALDRVVEAEIFIDKNILGGDVLGVSNRIEPVQQDLKLTLKAKRSTTIRNTIVDAFNVFNAGRVGTINRIRVRGKDENSNDIIIDSELISKMQYVEATLNRETGEVNSEVIFTNLEAIARHL